METKSCQNCKNDFVIESDDLSYYEKISSASGRIPPPTWCPDCRVERRFAMQNTWNLHWRNCAKCDQKTLSIYPPTQEDSTVRAGIPVLPADRQDKEITVYCQPCWWADSWDGTEYGMDYDPTRPFLEQVKELGEKTPYSSLTSLYTSLKNSEYSNALAWSKDCYLVFWADFCESVYYSSLLNTLKFSADCLRAKDSELCYEAIGINKCYRTFYSKECDACVDVWFSRNCYNCTNCIGCANLRGSSYCILNEKYSKEDYEAKVKELALDTFSGQEKFKQQAYEFWNSMPRREYTGNSLNVNVTGEYTFESKNSKDMYICAGAEDCKRCQFITVAPARDCQDYSGWGNNATQIYECVTVGENSNSVYFSMECWPDCLNVEYSYFSISGKNNFGCVNLKRKKYCILNKEYSKEEYEALVPQIIEDMKKNPYVDALGRKYGYGEFFPSELSKIPYNKSNAMRFFPKTKEQALAQGYVWYDETETTREATMQPNQLPETITETTEDLLKETIACAVCTKPYRIVKGELELLQKMNLPLPHNCPKCRENARFARLNPIKLYARHCAKCEKPIVTAFSPDKPDMVYCVSCYQKEIS